MFIHDVSESDFIEVLGALPNTSGDTCPHYYDETQVVPDDDDPDLPGFSRKVLNSAAIEPRVTLLRFDRVP